MDVKEKVKSIIADQLEIDIDKLTMETTFEEIDADSLDLSLIHIFQSETSAALMIR